MSWTAALRASTTTKRLGTQNDTVREIRRDAGAAGDTRHARAHAVSDEAKARAAALSPATDAATVQRLLAETSAARGMMVKRGSPSFSGVKDVRASLSRADMGGTLNIRELMDIAGVLTAARMARTYAAGDGRGNEKTCIDGLFNSLITNRFLEDKITGLHRGPRTSSPTPQARSLRPSAASSAPPRPA